MRGSAVVGVVDVTTDTAGLEVVDLAGTEVAAQVADVAVAPEHLDSYPPPLAAPE
jgi:hypothetical protein